MNIGDARIGIPMCLALVGSAAVIAWRGDPVACGAAVVLLLTCWELAFYLGKKKGDRS